MSDDKVQEINKQQKDPNAKLREEFDKEWQPKLADQRKKTVQAIRVANNEKKALNELLTDYEEEKTAFNTALKDLG